jgi:hypothetical protein
MNGLRNPGLRILLIPAASACVPVIPLRGRNASGGPQPVPPDIDAIFNHSAYVSARREPPAMDLDSGRVIVRVFQGPGKHRSDALAGFLKLCCPAVGAA